MRPERENIGAPDLPPSLVWTGEKPGSMPALTAAGPVLVHFFDYSQLNSVRTLPYVLEWDRRYRGAGLRTIGVQAPRFPFGSDPANVAAGVRDLGIELPVAIDAGRDLWHAYGCEGWPSLFLWSTGGALTWFHFGEGEYLATEEAIQEELRQLDALRALPGPMEALRPTDVTGVTVVAPTPELFPGGSWERPWEDGELELDYEAGGAFATVEGEGTLTVTLDDTDPHQLQINGARLYELAEHEHHQAHHLKLEPSDGLRIWSVSFVAGLP